VRHQASKKLYNYWDRIRRHRSAPDRQEIEPAEIRDILADTFILEVDQTFRTISFRLAGTRLCNAYGRELKGVGFLGLWDEQDNLGIYHAIRQVYEHIRPCTVSYTVRGLSGQQADYEMLFLPLTNRSSNAVRILGTATPNKAQRWLGTEAITSNQLKAVRFLDQLDVVLDVTEEDTVLSTEPSWPSLEGEFHRKVAHLTVLEGGAGK